MSELPKTFDPAAIEAKWYAHWEETGAFRPARPDAEPFTIVNPPPNVTGSLHIGHALDNTLQDILIRHARLKGKDALWVVGMDHAGIATQMVVERQMAERQDKRTNYSREQFVEKVWQWKAESGGQITGQLRRLGCSMDWSREQFTMDPHFSRAVTKVFVDLYNQGLIYRDKRLVNWDPGLKTAISDLEVETREVKGSFWHFRYPLADGVTLDDGRDHIVVATTRPETMLADMAVAVNAADARYQSVIGKYVTLPITGRRIPIIADDHADPELGSGAVKITPGHDFNDFEVGRRAGIEAREMLNMFDGDARVVQVADDSIPADLVGLDRFDARKAVVAQMKAIGLLVPHMDKDGAEHDAEPRTIQTPFGDRSGQIIEPWLTDQWYVDAKTLAQPAIAAVRSGAIEIVPKSWEKTWFNWMENIQPWCVSRQLWWGHRIPVWYGPIVVNDTKMHANFTVADGFKAFVAEHEEAAKLQAAAYYGFEKEIIISEDPVGVVGAGQLVAETSFGNAPILLHQDNDVLDTWFSSALWPFATLGWPDGADAPLPLTGGAGGGVPDACAGTPLPNPSRQGEGLSAPSLLSRHYPNDVLISGFDILFFWDARMAMQGIHFMNDVPWKKLYLHGLVRAADGSKMSKSKGNTVDPLGLIDRYGADALRFFMAAMESQGRDIKMDERRVEGYRNFATKLWNAARFAQANGIGASSSIAAPPATLAVNRWIIGEVVDTLAKLDKAFDELRFDAMADAIYHFVWDTYCDWYLELIKGQIDDETRAVAGWAFDQILVMLHPFMPFITEELWDKMGARGGNMLIHAAWPEPGAVVDADAKAEVEWLIDFIKGIRSTRAALDASAKLMSVFVSRAEAKPFAILDQNLLVIKRMARADSINVRTEAGIQEIESLLKGSDFSLDMLLDAENLGEVQLVAEGIFGRLDFYGEVDIAAARDRFAKMIDSAAKERDSLAGRLDNPSFVERAKPEAVEKARADHAEKASEVERLTAALARLN